MTVEDVVERGGEADDVLRAVVEALGRETAGWVGIAFVEGDRLELGPSAGGEPPHDVQRQPIEWKDSTVAELQAAGGDTARLTRVAELIAPYCLVGWDTGGEAWNP